MSDGPAPWISRMRASLRHAFAVEPAGPAIPDEVEREVVERILNAIVKRGMTGPTLLMLESMRPLNYVSAQALHYFTPFASVIIDPTALRSFAKYLERRGSVAWMSQRLEELDAKPDGTSGVVGDAERRDLGA